MTVYGCRMPGCNGTLAPNVERRGYACETCDAICFPMEPQRTIPREKFREAADRILRDHKPALDYLRDK